MDWTSLAHLVEGFSRDVDVAIDVTVRNGSSWQFDATRQVPAASTAKIPIMVETFRRIDRAEVHLSDLCDVTEAHKSAGSGVVRYLHAGLRLTIGDLLYLMVAISDNTATNILIEAAGMNCINATMSELGMRHSILGRPMVGRLAVAGEQENLATARDYTGLMSAIVEGRAASAKACKSMLDLLSKQQNNRRIGWPVPTVPGYRWGAKNGTNRGIVNDVGFIDTPRGTLLLAIYLQRVPDEITGEAMIAQLTACALDCCGLMPRRDT